MNTSALLPFYYPTTVMCIDDAEDALRALNGVLLGANQRTQCYSDLSTALSHLNRQDLLPNKPWISHRADDESIDARLQSVDFKKIPDILLDEKRSEQISVVIVDYDMPGMNGVEFCKKITNPYVRKILLTGVADEKIGISALNCGFIHQYLRKQDYNLPEKIRESIKLAQQQYFEALASEIISISRNDATSILSHNESASFLAPYIAQAAEYYLCCPSGSFVFLDSQGTQSSLVIKHVSELDSDAEQTEDIAPPELSLELKEHRKMLHTSSIDSFFGMSSDELASIAVSAEPIATIPEFYFSR